MIACITHEDINGDRIWHVLCYDGKRVIEIRPPVFTGWEDHQIAYDQLFEVYPDVDLIGPESWYLTIADDMKQQPQVAPNKEE